VAGVVREGLSGARRAYLHRRAAAARVAAYAGRLPEVAGRLAADYAEAGDPARAAEYAAMAAEHAMALVAPAEAAAFYRQALAHESTPAWLMGLARALLWGGDLGAARETYEQALAAYEAAGDRRGMARSCLALAEVAMPAGRPEQAHAWAMRSLDYLDDEADPEGHALAHFVLGASGVDSAIPAEAEAHLAEAVALANTHGLPGLIARSTFTLGNLRSQQGDLPGAVAAFRKAIAVAQEAGDLFQELLAYNNAAYNTLLLGDPPAARALVEAGLDLAERRGLRVPLQYLYSTRGEIALAEGDPAAARAWFERGLAEAETQGNARQAANYQANMGLAARADGDLAAAQTHLEAARAAAAPLVASYLQTQIDLWLADLYHAQGDPAAARAALARAESHLASGSNRGLQAEADRLASLVESTP
jgi:tetratricopeptide (TPR) repeat protein